MKNKPARKKFIVQKLFSEYADKDDEDDWYSLSRGRFMRRNSEFSSKKHAMETLKSRSSDDPKCTYRIIKRTEKEVFCESKPNNKV